MNGRVKKALKRLALAMGVLVLLFVVFVAFQMHDKNAEPGMSASELDALVVDLLERVMYDVPEEYHIDTDEFGRYARDYYVKRFGAIGE